MAWTDGADQTTGTVITATIWNNYLGTAGSIQKTAPAVVTTAGDIVYATGDNAIARLAVGSANTVLRSTGSAPAWGTVAATEITANNWKLFYSNGSGATIELALGASGTVLSGNGTSAAPTFAAPAGGGSWTLEAADTTERGFTNSSDAQLFQITSLSIAATKPLKILAHVYGTVDNASFSGSPQFYIRGFNGTQIADFGAEFLADSGKTYIWQYELTWGPREQIAGSREYGYANTIAASAQRDTGNPSGIFGSGSANGSRRWASPSNSSVPTTSTITSIEFGTIGYSTNQFYCKNVFVYSLSVS